MEHDSSRSGYHEPEPGLSGLHETEDWGDDYPKAFSVHLIWAQAVGKSGREGAIGFNGELPWHLSEDLKRFKELTVSHPVIMGRKTWESLDVKYRPLPNRDNIVVTRSNAYVAPGATVANNLEAALDFARQEAIPDDGMDRSEIWVIGGAELFQQTLAMAKKVYVTQIRAQVDADTYAPDMDSFVQAGLWRVSEEGPWLKPADENSRIAAYRFVTYERQV
ncbi:dihydrofolate reductase [Bifidobacterium tsurumiense]|uniref:dihydrofolate reductase n=1 Tax=Bifidobacterium tsurumiense TaxID=356829 RepID=A0A087EC44_9BIFI|nr:dihydrofolate reductase [Bifidobacterium tsurumiense]KFJ05345.1 dihydrofolate reductase [Bifidobacterium tsurumiense]MDY4677971.1 dihydrofolate reductase [Bifidobacterium tsurumiense]MSS12270.1 dihydrofolate reductase [Bifidobacterium tsurumiense]